VCVCVYVCVCCVCGAHRCAIASRVQIAEHAELMMDDRPKELLWSVERSKREERKKVQKPHVSPATEVFRKERENQNLSCRQSMKSTGFEDFTQCKETLKAIHASRKVDMLVDANLNYEDKKREQVLQSNDFSPFNWQVRIGKSKCVASKLQYDPLRGIGIIVRSCSRGGHYLTNQI